MSSNLSTLTSS